MSEQVTESIIVKATPQQVFSVLSDFSSYPQFAPEINSVQVMNGEVSRWTIDGVLGKKLEFDLETTRLDANQRIGWNTKGHTGDLTTSGQIVLAELPDQQTNIMVTLNYEGGLLANLLQRDPGKKVGMALRRFKEYIENRPAGTKMA